MLSRETSDLLHREHSMHSPNPTPAMNTPTTTNAAAVLPCAAATMADQVVADAAPAVPAAAGMCEMSTTPPTKSRSTLSSTSLAVAARTAENATTTTMTAQSQPSVVPCTHNTHNGSGGQGAKVHVVALHLSDGTVVHGTPYRNAVCGHHIMLAVEHGIWKATLAVRERCFYEAIARCTSASDTAWLTMGSGAKEEQEDWAHAYVHAAQLLLPFLPRYVGTRRVVAMQLPDRHTRSLSPHTLALLAAEGAPLVTTPAEPSLNKDITENDKAAQQWPCEVVQRVIGQFNAGLQAVQHGSPALREDMEGNASDEARAEERNDSAIKEEEACALAGSPLARLVHCATAPVPAATQSIEMIAMEDVCYGFVHPCVLDIKMGSRQYGLHPSPAKKRSKEEKALRTTSAKYGIRLAGFKRWDNMRGRYVARSKKELYGLSIDGVREAVRHFFTIDTTAPMGREDRNGAEEGEEEMSFLQEVNISEDVTRQLQDKVIGLLHELRGVFAVQSVFRFFTSSLLCVYDAGDPVRTCRIAMIDFAYVYDRVELRCAADADGAMERDEGYLFALDQLLSLFHDETEGTNGSSCKE